MKIGKLVRDKIPEIIKRSGKKPIYRTLSDAEYLEALEKKLDEEIAEFHESKSIEELADVLEVLSALRKSFGYTDDQVIDVRLAKYNERGGFSEKIFLEEVIENV